VQAGFNCQIWDSKAGGATGTEAGHEELSAESYAVAISHPLRNKIFLFPSS